jgi:hypothetical protein
MLDIFIFGLVGKQIYLEKMDMIFRPDGAVIILGGQC